MEQKIKDYEKFIEKAAKHPSKDLAAYHQEMVTNFQHERLVHLLIMLFFILLTIISIAVIFFLSVSTCEPFILIPVCLLSLILFILSLFYIKHYYFLENHIQNLYKYNQILH